MSKMPRMEGRIKSRIKKNLKGHNKNNLPKRGTIIVNVNNSKTSRMKISKSKCNTHFYRTLIIKTEFHYKNTNTSRISRIKSYPSRDKMSKFLLYALG